MMTRNTPFRLVRFILVAAAAAIGSGGAAPNVVVFLADDAGWGDYSRSGNLQLSTPNIDSIATGGVSLDRFYVSPVCSPTRAEFLTGRYHPRTGVNGVSTGRERLSTDERTIADSFKAAGYETGLYGKWHNGSQWPYHPLARGFDDFFGYTAGHWGEYMDAPLEENGRMVKTRGFIVDVITDRAVDFIGRSKDRPFFCFIPFTTPHTPWKVPDEDWTRFKDKAITQHATDTAAEVTDEARCAYAMLENQDRNVGKVLAKLRETGISDDTIVVYFSDNGPNTHRWNGGMKGKKGGVHEGGVRSVCYIRWPSGLEPGKTVTDISGAIDLMPTLLSLAGIRREGDKPLDGRDISPLFGDTGNVAWPDRTLFSTWNGNVSARTPTHRLDHGGNLFDMAKDPGQTTPINGEQPALAAKLKGEVAAWREEMKILPPGKKPKAAEAEVDPRPFTVGYRKFPITMLPARDGMGKGGITRSSSAPNNSYFTNWTTTDGRIVWNIDVHTAGIYQVSVDYSCPEADTGSDIILSFGDGHLAGKVAPSWDPPLLTNQDTLPRPKAETAMKEFRALGMGKIHLAKGKGDLVLRATAIRGKTVMDLRRITLTLLEPREESR